MSAVPSRRDEIIPPDFQDGGPGTSLTIEINNIRPVELLDLTAALLAVADQFKAFVRRRAQGRPVLYHLLAVKDSIDKAD